MDWAECVVLPLRFIRCEVAEAIEAINFAHAVGIEPETLSRAENGHQILSESNDKLIRLYYALSALDNARLTEARQSLRKALNDWTQSVQPKRP